MRQRMINQTHERDMQKFEALSVCPSMSFAPLAKSSSKQKKSTALNSEPWIIISQRRSPSLGILDWNCSSRSDQRMDPKVTPRFRWRFNSQKRERKKSNILNKKRLVQDERSLPQHVDSKEQPDLRNQRRSVAIPRSDHRNGPIRACSRERHG